MLQQYNLEVFNSFGNGNSFWKLATALRPSNYGINYIIVKGFEGFCNQLISHMATSDLAESAYLLQIQGYPIPLFVAFLQL